MSYWGAIRQRVIASTSNDYISPPAANINAGATLTNSGESTLNVAGIQVNFKADQNFTIYVEQSPDNTNWDISDAFNYYYIDGGWSQTVQATASYFRIRAKNNGASATTYVRLQTALCPIVEAVPRTLDHENGALKVCIEAMDGIFGQYALVTPMNEQKITASTRLVGTNFSGTTIDTNFWTSSATGTGAATQGAGSLTLNTGATANSTSTLASVRTARYVAAHTNFWRGIIRLPAVTTSTGTNSVKFGAFDANNGYFFEAYQGTGVSTPLLKVTARKSTVDTVVSSGSFNGNVGTTVALTNNATTYEIYWTNSKAWFFVGGSLIHTMTGSTATLSDTTHLPIGFSISNAGGNTADNTAVARVMSISRLGELVTQPVSKYQSGTTAALILKYGPGNLHKVIVSGVANNSVITLYDNTAASGTIIWSTGTMSANTTPFDIDFDGTPFSIGLTLVISGANANACIVYE